MGLKRYVEPNTVYFVTSVTHERNPIFNDRLATELLLNIILYNKFACHYHIYGFIVMPDHFHLIIQPYKDTDLSAIIRRIKGNFARFYNIQNRTSDSIWQKSFYDRGLRDYQELLKTLEYIHSNPVRAGLITDRNDYEFSSSAYYECGDRRFALWIDAL
ncbi:Transposase IS200-like [Syntrophomonas zehnderi OL-4]|uniref:Transposase IS200-like n=1 Tax=Syntrophomonas zehnderi OL-4 TaxID=690567 RepID=A0A0E4C7V1_9FIRM|nr:transposase [Syntrophomonas zehnderi]CFX12632.1 Transposase IS200-like [Syntrophomonas zehnderi OL-4]